VHGTNTWLLQALGLFLLASRATPALAVSQVNENDTFRVVGMAMSFTTLITASAYVLYSYMGRSALMMFSSKQPPPTLKESLNNPAYRQ
jgi:uncharacterized membrane protein YecN with MAPEG domain